MNVTNVQQINCKTTTNFRSKAPNKLLNCNQTPNLDEKQTGTKKTELKTFNIF